VRSQVRLQHVTLEEPLATDSAAELPILLGVATPMVTHVFVQVTALRKRSVAERARVRSFAGVQTHVCLEVVTLSEAPTTCRTREGTFSSVSAFVSLQIGRLHTSLFYTELNDKIRQSIVTALQ